MRSVKAKYIWGVALVLALVLGLALGGTPAQARSLDSREEAALFSLGDLGPVDLSPKTVTVEVYVAPERGVGRLPPHAGPGLGAGGRNSMPGWE